MIHRIRAIGPDLDFVNRICAAPTDPFNANPNVSQIRRKPIVVDAKVDEVANPIGREFHFN